MLRSSWPILLIALLTFNCNPDPEGIRKPNILLFLVDDMGWTDTSVPFADLVTDNNRYFHTPNMQRLRDMGMQFTQAYSSSPVCSPTRTSILTGMNPARSHITNWIPGENNDSTEHTRWGLPPEWKIDGLGPNDVTLPKLLKQAGYVNIHIGKAHFGRAGTPGADPRNLGFDINVGGTDAGHPASYYPPYGAPDNDHHVPGLSKEAAEKLYLNDALTVHAVQLIDSVSATGKPFFMNMAHYALHTPIQGDTTRLTPYVDTIHNRAQQAYATMVESMDASLGRILDALERDGQLDNTLIVFMSDNGGLATHAGPPTTNYPLAYGKGTNREGGIRVPMLAAWPGRIKPKTKCDVPVIADDFMPTFLSVAGLADQTPPLIDGVDLTPLFFRTGNIKDRALIWHFPHYWASKSIRDQYPGIIGPFSAIRYHRYKLIYDYDRQRTMVFDLQNDVGETNDLMMASAEITTQLMKTLHEYLLQVGAPMPVDKRNGRNIYPHL